MSEKRNCLSCNLEPEWSKWHRGTQSRIGKCKWEMNMPISGAYELRHMDIRHFADDSGLPPNCPAWKAKKTGSDMKEQAEYFKFPKKIMNDLMSFNADQFRILAVTIKSHPRALGRGYMVDNSLIRDDDDFDYALKRLLHKGVIEEKVYSGEIGYTFQPDESKWKKDCMGRVIYG